MMKLTILFILIMLSASVSPRAFSQTSDSAVIKVMYFHGPTRCPTCIAIEKSTTDAVNTNFAEELKTGTISLESIDFQTDSTEHFSSEYKFDVQTLIIAKFVGGKQVNWKNLDKIWDLVGNYRKFEKYVVKEIKALRREK